MKYNILFVATHRPNRAPGQRFRFEEFLPFFQEVGFHYKYSFLFNADQDQIFYGKGKFLNKALILCQVFVKRALDILQISKYDIVFIQREAMIFGPAFFERLIKFSNAKIIFDFDDSIWLSNVSESNKKFAWMKFPRKTSSIIRMSDMIFAGNNFLANYALKFNSNVRIIPTTIDTVLYYPINESKFKKNQVCIGWSGSITTIEHFKLLIPVLKRVYKKYGDFIYFKVIGDESYINKELNIKGVRWNSQTEVEDLSEIEIGIMPLPDNDWAKGKCGLKGLQYMALGIATIMSPVGVNTEIIENFKNGYLASTEEEWFEYLCFLIENRQSSKEIGLNGRMRVEEKYSIKALKDTYINYFLSMVK